MPLQIIDEALLELASAEARNAPRLRKNRNFHPTNDYPGHRLLNAIEPGSYVVPHRHCEVEKDETLVVLRGSLGVIEFDDGGRVVQAHVLRSGQACGVDIPHGTWHSVLALETGTVFFEAKAGPYRLLQDDEKGAWAPVEGSSAVPAYYAWMRSLFPC